MEATFKDLLKERVIVFDGAMGTSIQKLNLTGRRFWRKGRLRRIKEELPGTMTILGVSNVPSG